MGLTIVDMASMLVEQQKLAEGEALADRGYQLMLTQHGGEARRPNTMCCR